MTYWMGAFAILTVVAGVVGQGNAAKPVVAVAMVLFVVFLIMFMTAFLIDLFKRDRDAT